MMNEISVNIVCELSEDEAQQFNVITQDRNSVVGLIRKVCKENNILMKNSMALKNKKGKILQWSQTLLHCGVRDGDVLYLTNEEEVGVRGSCRWNNWWFVAAISLLIGGVGIIAITLLFSRNGQPQYQYGVVLDAGSTHTMLFVYKWDARKKDNTALAQQINSIPVAGDGLTSYQDNATLLSGPLSDCLIKAKLYVPSESRGATPIFMGATAGMRMLNEVYPNKSDAILAQVRATISANSSLYFPDPAAQARIISGQEEGTFGWITTNYLSGNLGVTPAMNLALGDSDYEETTIGALDMGGASTQITFYTPDHAQIPVGYREDLDLYGKPYTVYTYSYLCYGINEAMRQYQAILVKDQGYNTSEVLNPCGPKGYNTTISYSDIFEAPCANKFLTNFKSFLPLDKDEAVSNYTFLGTGNISQCQTYVRQLFNFDAHCMYPQCTFNGTYQPPLHGRFYAFSSFFYEMDFLNLTNQASRLEEFQTSLGGLCNLTWDQVKVIPTRNQRMLGWYCFEGHYIHTLLIDAYKFDNKTWSNIKFVQKINNTDVGWTLGYMLNSSLVIESKGTQDFISVTAFSLLTVLFGIFLLLSVAFGCYARKYQTSNTIYDRLPTYGAV